MRTIIAASLSICVLGSISLSSEAKSDILPKTINCTGCFFGLPVVLKPTPKPTKPIKKILSRDLYFVDTEKVVWKADKGDVTDGASIPSVFLPVLGGDRFEGDFLPAAIIHDHYCKRRVRTWWQTARLFYQAMIANRTNVVKAKTMYYAVYTFGPHWGALDKGKPCGENCINVAPNRFTLKGDGTTEIDPAGEPIPPGQAYYERPAHYNASQKGEIADVYEKVRKAELEGAPLSLDQLDNIAAAEHKEDPFIQKAGIIK